MPVFDDHRLDELQRLTAGVLAWQEMFNRLRDRVAALEADALRPRCSWCQGFTDTGCTCGCCTCE